MNYARAVRAVPRLPWAAPPGRLDLSGCVVVFECLKKRRRGVFRAVPVPPELLDTLDMVHGIREP